MTRVLVLTTEPLPLPGQATTGAGLRAWGLAEGLRASGFDVVIGTPLHGEDEPPRALNGELGHVCFFRRDAIGTLLHEIRPQVVVLQHWGLAADVPELSVPLVIDLAGPHLLERAFWGSSNAPRDLEEKLAALRRADLVTCSGEYQRHYFYPFLLQAGFSPQFAPPVIPFSLPGTQPAAASPAPRETTFIYGGAFLAWQDPSRAINWLLDEMDSAGRGRLLFYGGSHPVVDASAGKFAQLTQLLKEHPRVEMRGWRPFDELLHEYAREGDVALDLMARNAERELAFTTRTMVYLHCGLPVIYNNYSELSGIIEQSGAGWTFDPEDEQSFRSRVRQILTGEIELLSFRTAAREAAASYRWSATITPLAEFCRNPVFRPGKMEHRLAYETQHGPSAQVPALGVRLRQQLNLGRLLAPLVYVLAQPLRFYLWLKMRGTVVSKFDE